MTKPSIGWFTASCLLVSNIIGGAIFTTTGFIARDLGDPYYVLAAWGVGAMIALGAALTYSELPAALPQAGGDYIYLRAAYGALPAFLSGWTSFTIGFGAAIAASAVSFASYAGRVFPTLDVHMAVSKALALLLVWILTLVHLRGIGVGGLLQRWLTSIKIAAIGAFILIALLIGEGNWSHFDPPFTEHAAPSSIVVPLIFVLYTYLGWNVIGYVASEITSPQATIPKVVIGSVAAVALLYLLLNVVYLYALPMSALTTPPLLPVAEKAAAALWGPAASRFVAMLLCLSIAGGVSAMIWAGPRVYRTMANDGIWPHVFQEASGEGVPTRAMVMQTGWASVLIVTGTFEQLVVFSGFVLTIFTALTLIAVMVLRRRQPALPRPYRAPGYPFIPLLAIAPLLLIVFHSLLQRPWESSLGLATVLTGVPFYLYWSRRPAS